MLTLDASKGVTANEKRIAGAILDSKSSVLVVVNKSDLLLSEKGTKEAYEKEVRNELKFLPWVPIVFVSALEGRNVGAVVDMAVQVHTERLARIPTRQLWDMVQRAQLRRPPPSKGHLRLKVRIERASRVAHAHCAREDFLCNTSQDNNTHLCVLRERACAGALHLRALFRECSARVVPLFWISREVGVQEEGGSRQGKGCDVVQHKARPR